MLKILCGNFRKNSRQLHSLESPHVEKMAATISTSIEFKESLYTQPGLHFFEGERVHDVIRLQPSPPCHRNTIFHIIQLS